MGANIGTTVTGWLVSSVEWAKALSPANIAPVAVMIGVIVMLTGKRRSTKDISSIIVGFGILFIGITTMSDAVEPLQQSEAFCNLFVTLGHSPFLGIVAGALVTAVIQSSSASVGILQSLAAAGLVPLMRLLHYHGTEYRYLCDCHHVQYRGKEDSKDSSCDASVVQHHRYDHLQRCCDRIL